CSAWDSSLSTLF
nr:immunoglobulin light chain junction region [Macaca mulatta]MPN65232.1 immunoglobulin light chain junction region [Macaca mulatta]MPN65237.1 immunoglobulin light chain junction region [Macaca mulatta]MPN65252.1 immunoglobulin light chain junction region [Macaca mulatta]MPN65277.1 immunoglobulin light chain junction region [Macaca mulatta]